ncbi:MAG: hypothetical protein ACOCVZ_08555 [Gemmatimonadota bacterium]
MIEKGAWTTGFRALGAGLVLSLAGCSLPGSGEASPEALSFRTEIGRVPESEAAKELPGVLGAHGYQIEDQRRTPHTFTVATHWRVRAPFADEGLLGVEAVETRLVVEGHASMGEFSMDLRAESRVPERGEIYWQEVPTTAEFEAYARKIASDVRVKLVSGVRVK